MTLRRMNMSALRDKYSHFILDERQSKLFSIEPKLMCVISVQLRVNVLAAKADGTFFDHSSRRISTKQKLTARLKLIRRPCANDVCGLAFVWGS
jgi:hypothetical protein